MKNIFRFILLISIVLSVISCNCKYNNDVTDYGILTTQTDDDFLPFSGTDTLIFLDSSNNQLEFIATGIKLTHNDWSGGPMSSCGTYTGILESKKLTFLSTDSMYSIIYQLRPEYDGAGFYQTDDVKIIVRDSANTLHYFTKSNMPSNYFDWNGETVWALFKERNDRMIRILKGKGIIYFEDDYGKSWTLKE